MWAKTALSMGAKTTLNIRAKIALRSAKIALVIRFGPGCDIILVLE
jgi:hypothetical protein